MREHESAQMNGNFFEISKRVVADPFLAIF